MDKIKLVLQREYITRVKNKTFILLTLLVPVLFLGISILPAYLMQLGGDLQKVAIVDEFGAFKDSFKEHEEYEINYFTSDVYQDLIDNFEDGSYKAIVHIPKREHKQHILGLEKEITFYTSKKTGLGLPNYLSKSIERTIRNLKIDYLELNKNVLEQVETDVSFTKIIHNQGEQSELEGIVGSVSSIVLGFIIYIFIFMYGAQIMQSVIEEKNSRIIEIIISSVKPFQLLMGKILGVALVGLTQFAIWMILFGLGYIALLSLVSVDLSTISQMPQSELDENVMHELLHMVSNIKLVDVLIGIGLFLYYFLIGFLLYAGLFAAVGSAVEHQSETQQFMLPLSAPLLVAIMIAQMGMSNPDSALIYWCSFIPFTSPVVMMVRIQYGVPGWEIALSMALLLLGFILVTKFAAKIYKTGILMYGKKASFKEIIKWVRYKN